MKGDLPVSGNSPRLALLALDSVTVMAFSACGAESKPQDVGFDLEIKDHKLTLDPAVMRVNQGDAVTMRIGTDEHGTFHLHGYDIEVDLDPSETAIMELTANASGSFNITFHAGNGEGDGESSHEEEEEKVIASLEVRPR
jgi:hypothetical protein